MNDTETSFDSFHEHNVSITHYIMLPGIQRNVSMYVQKYNVFSLFFWRSINTLMSMGHCCLFYAWPFLPCIWWHWFPWNISSYYITSMKHLALPLLSFANRNITSNVGNGRDLWSHPVLSTSLLSYSLLRQLLQPCPANAWKPPARSKVECSTAGQLLLLGNSSSLLY